MRLNDITIKTMVEIAHGLYAASCQKDKDGSSILTVQLTRIIYGCLKFFLLFWKLLSKVLKYHRFKSNPYDNCVMNKNAQGNRCIIVSKIKVFKTNYKITGVMNYIINTLSDIFGRVTLAHGDIHTYLGIALDFSKKMNSLLPWSTSSKIELKIFWKILLKPLY